MTLQVTDDPELLELMLADLAEAPERYKPTNYWANYQVRFVDELRREGLRDFRRKDRSVLRSFGAVDFDLPIAAVQLDRARIFTKTPLGRIPGVSVLARKLNAWANRNLSTIDGIDAEQITRLGYYFAESYGRHGHARPIADVETSLVGNPKGIVCIEGRPYTRLFIRYYLQYAYVSRFLDFEQIASIAELGSGMGRQTEVIRKLHPKTSHFLFDLPPQLYVAEQYLSAVFPGQVVSYRTTRSMPQLPLPEPGKIYIFSNVQMERMSKIDLFWNSASFHEMEPDVVANYLGFVNAAAGSVYIAAQMSGQKLAARAGAHGVMKRTVFDDYLRGLPDFELVDRNPMLRITGTPQKEENLYFRRTQPPR